MIDATEIKLEAMNLMAAGVRGQHSNNKVIRLCQEIERLQRELEQSRSEFAAAGVILRAYDAELLKRGIIVKIGV